MPQPGEYQFKIKDEMVRFELPRRWTLDRYDPYPRIKGSPFVQVPPEEYVIDYKIGENVAIYVDLDFKNQMMVEQLRTTLSYLHASGAYAQEISLIFSKRISPEEVPETMIYKYDCIFLSEEGGNYVESGRTPESFPISYLREIREKKINSIYAICQGSLDPIFGVKTVFSSAYDMLSKESWLWFLNYRATTSFLKALHLVNSSREYLPFSKIKGGLLYFEDLGIGAPIYNFFKGSPQQVHDEVIDHVQETYYFEVPGEYDLAIFGVTSGDPKGIHRALAFNPEVVKQGGTIIFYSPSWEMGEEFEEKMMQVLSSKRVESIENEQDVMAYEMGRALMRCDMIFVGKGSTSIVESVETIDEAISIAMKKEARNRKVRVALLPYADYTITRWE